jgi:prepilin-type N-terminal cleavage/methylation domain-containing protein
MKKGFTLIELLVVVLIIGILSAIALPQYLYAKEKSALSEALIMKRAIDDAAYRYYLQTGSKPSSFNDLDIVLPATCSNDISCSGKNFSYYMAAGSYYKIRSNTKVFELQPNFFPDNTFSCITSPEYKAGIKLCTELCGTQTPYMSNVSYNYYMCQ